MFDAMLADFQSVWDHDMILRFIGFGVGMAAGAWYFNRNKKPE